ncbi:diaminopimelate epimerase [Phaeodactylibacter luteus]|uniref:Diaminopimelate epimerase n=1 Tax=Phaeodactylibacter luteus TaxID=1564516 RepID=A0A5C6RHT8_9BACT|nr:diaminopimelate epimerase [Phaeodactylibacter luteus]TXB61966.1 diaminopimelate epimerase [Phaeodactylibacter luteus]
MKVPFYKYQGTGNDFILIDQRKQQWLSGEEQEAIAHLCHRRLGIGADGLILLRNREGYDFEMDYFNADGRRGSMCGNGGRCTVAFAHALGIPVEECQFWAPDGPHRARLRADGWVELEMADVQHIEAGAGYYFLDTGSPHYVQFVTDLAEIDVVQAGRAIRFNERFKAQGTNVNFVQKTSQGLEAATYERGVEDETLSCGTGATACALANSLAGALADGPLLTPIQTKGGQLEVRFRKEGARYTDIWLCGPAVQVFQGQLSLPGF